MIEDEDPQREKIFELEQEIVRLRGQITYLQEELSSSEDELARVTNRFEYRIDRLEQELGDALYRREE
jgi:predicted  nucleic acid-binding Zn-ribbon protein